jgi:polar amino acid transport system substrate-binding protein
MMPRMLSRLCRVLCGIVLAACAAPPPAAELHWGGDAEGGAPFVEADPANPSQVHGFDVEIAGLIAQGLGRQPRFTQVGWASLEQSLARGDFDVGLSGVEDRAELRARFAVSLPYYEFREVLTVRSADTARFRTLGDLSERRVGTLGATMAYRLLLDAQRTDGVIPVSYDDDVHPYSDLLEGRVDAVLLDHVLAERALRRMPGLAIQPVVVARGHYVAIFAKPHAAMRDSADAVLRARMRDGTLEQLFRRWGVWDSTQAVYQQRLLASNDSASTPTAPVVTASVVTYLPALLRAAAVTLGISLAAMLLAIVAGGAIAAGRVYGGTLLRGALTVYVEVVRGTPVLLQLFVLYYGLSAFVRLPALLAAIIGLGLNYAAYESEIYRSALLSVPRTQLEAARTLGLSEWQVFRLVRGPQALRVALAPMTNDFVALLKDSSLVSVITVVELTKATAIYATNAGSWLVPGLLCAAIYLAMSLPLSRVARRLEARWSVA